MHWHEIQDMSCCVTFAHALLEQVLQVVTHCLWLCSWSRLHRSHCLTEALINETVEALIHESKKSASELIKCYKRVLSSMHDIRTKPDVLYCAVQLGHQSTCRFIQRRLEYTTV